MTDRTASSLYEAELKVARLRRALDRADETYTTAEAAWLAAIRERDRLAGVEYPTAKDVRGILAPDGECQDRRE
jgi:hypothetical protein